MKNARIRHPFRLAELKVYSDRWLVQYWIWDEEQAKLVRKQVRISGMRFKSDEEKNVYAQSLIEKINSELRSGKIISNNNQDKLYVREAIETYLAWKLARVRCARAYTGFLRNAFKNWCDQFKKGLPLADFKKSDVIEFLDYTARENDFQANTYNNYKIRIFNFFHYFAERELIPDNPAKGIGLRKVNIDDARYLPFQDSQSDELSMYLLNNDKGLWLFSRFIYYCFLRPNEVRNLKIGDIQLNEMRIRVSKTISKNKKTQYVAIPPVFAKILVDSGRFSRPSHLYILGRDQDGNSPSIFQIGKNTITARFRRILDRFGYGSEYSLYSWKHTGCCKLFKITKDVDLIRRQCRHSSLEVTQLYLRSLGMFADHTELTGFE